MDMLFLEIFVLFGVAGIAELWLIFFQDIDADDSMSFMAGFTILLIFKRLMDDFLLILLFCFGVTFDAFFLNEAGRSSWRSCFTTDNDETDGEEGEEYEYENVVRFNFQVQCPSFQIPPTQMILIFILFFVKTLIHFL